METLAFFTLKALHSLDRMLMLNLAVELCPMYQVQVPQATAINAQKAKDDIKAKQNSPLTMGFDVGLTGFGNLKGTYDINGRTIL